jgi:hypothetical protein
MIVRTNSPTGGRCQLRPRGGDGGQSKPAAVKQQVAVVAHVQRIQRTERPAVPGQGEDRMRGCGATSLLTA